MRKIRIKKHEIIFNFGAILSNIHSTQCPNELIRDSVWLDEMLRRAEFNLKHYLVEGTADLLQFLKTNKPLSIKNTLIHGDFTMDNVLVYDGKISSIIEWSGGGFGYGKKILGEQEYKYYKEGLYEFF